MPITLEEQLELDEYNEAKELWEPYREYNEEWDCVFNEWHCETLGEAYDQMDVLYGKYIELLLKVK
jgi:hypothetical protein